MLTDSNYQTTLDKLYSYVDYSLKHSSELAKAEFNLDRMRALMALLGDPQIKFKSIHITGTKGKGSTAAMCAMGLREAGFKVGLYTSPHLLEYTERIQIDDVPIEKDALVEIFNRVEPLLAKVEKITTFEITTALGFLYFAEQGVDWAVIEVGLGGRLDATNIIKPEVSVITTVSYDHTAVLGNTLTQIATEKAGIIKAGKPVVIGPQVEEALLAIFKIAELNNSTATYVPDAIHAEPVSADLTRQTFNVIGEFDGSAIDRELSIPLIGDHQRENALTAFIALLTVGVVNQEQIATGFAKVIWQCRFEVANMDPILIFDSAHNEDAFSRLAQTISAYLPDKKVILILGVSEDKHLVEMIDQVKPLLDTLIITRANHPRALPIEEINANLIDSKTKILPITSVPEALNKALELANNNGSIVVSAGSMFVTAEVKEAWIKRELNGKK